jgi:RNA polymerase sigma factor (sigma-70 family)
VPPKVNALTAVAPRSASEWLESPVLPRIVKRVACQHGILSGEIEDLVQEVRIALWGTEQQLEIKPRWVFVTASHKAVDILRRRRQLGAEAAISRATLAEVEELNCLVRAQVAHLPKTLRLFCDLRYVEGLTEREIACRMGLCRASVRWLGLRCLKALRAGRRTVRSSANARLALKNRNRF